MVMRPLVLFSATAVVAFSSTSSRVPLQGGFDVAGPESGPLLADIADKEQLMAGKPKAKAKGKAKGKKGAKKKGGAAKKPAGTPNALTKDKNADQVKSVVGKFKKEAKAAWKTYADDAQKKAGVAKKRINALSADVKRLTGEIDKLHGQAAKEMDEKLKKQIAKDKAAEEARIKALNKKAGGKAQSIEQQVRAHEVAVKKEREQIAKEEQKEKDRLDRLKVLKNKHERTVKQLIMKRKTINAVRKALQIPTEENLFAIRTKERSLLWNSYKYLQNSCGTLIKAMDMAGLDTTKAKQVLAMGQDLQTEISKREDMQHTIAELSKALSDHEKERLAAQQKLFAMAKPLLKALRAIFPAEWSDLTTGAYLDDGSALNVDAEGNVVPSFKDMIAGAMGTGPPVTVGAGGGVPAAPAKAAAPKKGGKAPAKKGAKGKKKAAKKK